MTREEFRDAQLAAIQENADLDYVMDWKRETIRVDGRAFCPDCCKPYYNHPPITANGFDSFYKGCDGSILKT